MSVQDSQSFSQDDDAEYVPIYDTKIDLKVRVNVENEQQQKYTQIAVFKILVRQSNDQLECVRFQLSDDEQLNFLYRADYDEQRFEEMKSEQDLDITFEDFPNVVRQIITQYTKPESKASKSYKVSFITGVQDEDEDVDDDQNQDDEPRPDICSLIIGQKLEFCTVEIFNIQFAHCDPERIKIISQRRYDEISQKLKEVQTEYKDICKRLQRQAPALFNKYVKPTRLDETSQL